MQLHDLTPFKFQCDDVSLTRLQSTDDDGFKSAILFINDCNGYCRIGNEKIYSKENKLVLFDSKTKHTGSTCTDKSRRIVINFIFTE